MKNPYFSLLSTAWRYAKEDRKLYVTIYSMFICDNLITAINPFFYGWFVNTIQKNGTNVIRSLWLYALGYLLLRLLEWAFHGPARVMERKLAFNLSKNFLDERYNQLIHLPVGWHKDHHSGSTINRLRKAYTALKDFFELGFVYFQTLMRFVISFSVMVYFSPLFGSIAVILGFITFWVILKFDKPFIASLKEVNEAEHKVSSNLFDSLSNIMTVITLRLEKRVHAGLMEKVNAILPPFKKNIVVNEWKWFTAQMLVALIYVVMVGGYVYQHNQAGKVFMLGGLVTLIGFVTQFISVFNNFAEQYTQIVQYHTDVETAKGIESAFLKEHRALNEMPLPSNWQTLEIHDLNFVHAKNSTAHPIINNHSLLKSLPVWKKSYGLKGMNLSIQRGKRIALIGESGCGKSTFLSLLRGLYEPSPTSALAVDGRLDLNFSHISNSVTLFPQEPEIFEATFEYNITLGLPFEKEEVKRVSDITRLSSVLENLELGLQSVIQEKGVNLSGGQKQRLALARGVLAAQASSIILLDEPTSSMDQRTEQEIYLNLFKEFEGKTIISSLHRLYLLEHFDYIYVLDKGRIAEEGSLEYLSENGVLFNKLRNHQKKNVTESNS